MNNTLTFNHSKKKMATHRKVEKEHIHVLLAKARGDNNALIIPSNMSAQEAFLTTEKELKRLNSIIRKKAISDDHIANSIFSTLRGEVSEEVFKSNAYDHFTAGYYAFVDIRKRLEKEKIFDDVGILKYGFIILTIIYDIRPLANFIGQQESKGYKLFSGGKSNIEDARWHYLGTIQLIYNCIYDQKMLDDKFALILSAVSLRQTIELKMQRLLGVADYFDLKGGKIFTHHYFFFDFIFKNKDHANIKGINIKMLKKIFDFCNASVHKGIMPYYWQMFYATKYCDPLFYDPDYDKKGTWHIHSSIKISKYNELKNKLYSTLAEKFPTPEYNLHITWITPEAQVID